MNPESGLTVITTHLNADFDALASMLAAQKLYPDALVVFPGSQEKNLRNFFISSMAYLFNMADIRSIDFSAIRRLVLVDTRQPSRIGKFAEILHNPGTEIHVYDHHPPMQTDIRGHAEYCRITGATVTLLCELIRKKGIEITADEATVMCLGIYEDTGSFTFPSTTAEDFLAAAHLLSCGANLNTISSMLAREISPEQVSLLNEMIQSANRYAVKGVEVVVTTVSSDRYVPDFAFLVHKLVKMENLAALFAVASMENKIHIVGRSRVPEVDVGAILSRLGGGGHGFAASATLKDYTLVQAEQKLVEIIYQTVRPRRLARDIMSSPAITIGPTMTCKRAAEMLNRYNINALLVTDPAQGQSPLLGYISRQVIEKALYHHLDEVAVREYMTSDMAWVSPEADLAEIQQKIIENKQRILPVVQDDKIMGVVTRTDLLNLIARQSSIDMANESGNFQDIIQARTRNILPVMIERLFPHQLQHLRNIGSVAREMGIEAFVVGGFVRDMFLNRPNDDMDIVVEGDGIAFARQYASATGARVHTHGHFGTAVITYPDGFKIDVATARMEYYQFPTALPIVEMSSIKLDLFRRDFTINTLAIQLNPDKFGILIDFFAGQKDIKEKAIRVLHNLSFVEDPTRAFRAIRFEQRFGFNMGKLTAGLIENAVKMDFFSRLSGRRVLNELRQIFGEQNPIPAIFRLNEFQLLRVIHPNFQLSADKATLLAGVKSILTWHELLFLEEPIQKWIIYFLVMMKGYDLKTAEDIFTRLEMPVKIREILGKERIVAEKTLAWLERHSPVLNSVLCDHLADIRTEVRLYMMALARQEGVKRAISQYFVKLRFLKPITTGEDLKRMGYPPGPIFKDILLGIRNEKLNGHLETKEDEIRFIQEHFPLPEVGKKPD
ncbi:CBS domain-containing protein [Desulfatirhabdium butyrativorans]|uniref:CBS domain-containing protein n=1 Tax=Desulfatirhabdium butyrativorans TaxID=340467 RepID=UPI000404EBA0|nr:CBS domain-containing protein [Desulfatirhabdium butyrativorans]